MLKKLCIAKSTQSKAYKECSKIVKYIYCGEWAVTFGCIYYRNDSDGHTLIENVAPQVSIELLGEYEKTGKIDIELGPKSEAIVLFRTQSENIKFKSSYRVQCPPVNVLQMIGDETVAK